jgi:tRNA dimethylallyltransferase
LDILTAKPDKTELSAVKHHLVDIIPRTKGFSVAEYVNLANSAIEDIVKRGKKPVIVGGTGLYINSIAENITFSEMPSDDDLRQKLQSCDPAELYEKLQKIDPVACEKIHPNNVKRVIRALEVFEITGKTFTELNRESRDNLPKFSVSYIGLTFHNRENLYNRINARTDRMFGQGVIEEAEKFYRMYKNSIPQNCSSIGAIGLNFLIQYIEGKITLAECQEMLKQSTRRYAKRQLTFFRNSLDVNWIYLD